MVEKIFTTEFSSAGGWTASAARAASAAPAPAAVNNVPLNKTPTAKRAIRLGAMNIYCVLFSVD
jgi:hypothetical protein